ncbi:MAG: hypothetical protein ABGF52_11810 [Candidatus Asgardarchaeum sp.]
MDIKSMIKIGYWILIIIYFIPIIINVPYLIDLWYKGLANPFSVFFSALPISRVVLSVTLLITSILTYIALLFDGKGITGYLLKSILDNGCYPYSRSILKIELVFRFFGTPIVLLLIALLGSALSFAFRSIIVLVIWYFYSTLLFLTYYPDLSKHEEYLMKIFKESQKLLSEARTKIIYADKELVLKEKVLIKRGWFLSKIMRLDNISSFGYVNSQSVYIKCGNLPILIFCSDGKRAYKILKDVIKRTSEEVSPASIREIEHYIFMRRLKYYGIIFVIFVSFVLLLIIYALPMFGV